MKEDVKQTIINTLIRLNGLRLKKLLNKETWQEFFLYKRIVAQNIDRAELSDDVKSIIDG